MASSAPPESMIALAYKMLARAKRDFLPPAHDLRVKALQLADLEMKRFAVSPPQCSLGTWVDAYQRAYAEWIVYLHSQGEEDTQ